MQSAGITPVQLAAMGVVGGLAFVLTIPGQQRRGIIRADTGKMPTMPVPAAFSEPDGDGKTLRRRNSWESKFESPRTDGLADQLAEASGKRLARRQSWAAKFEGSKA